ncbi:c-type cytochrome [Fundidesulfovibrio soli]|uniref:c-type cytochrome n=1 Tax=Fundidesulfovibrio soli TaxID=2922716 RepID=UPI001FAF25A2|nr:hypothetical protein [Fundidesulfovibrio soli]
MNRALLVRMCLIPLVAGLAAYLYFLMTGPDMAVQQALQSYDARMPDLPQGSVPANSGLFFPSERQGGKAVLPNHARGKFAYDAYCVFCHGILGDGEGPVGQSYVPAPGDLRTDRIRGMDDQALLKAMLTGAGHDPVLHRVVPPDDRPSLLLYVRSLIQARQAGQAGQARRIPEPKSD